MNGAAAGALLALVRVYQWLPKRGGACRFLPTCSSYAEEAIAVHGAARGTWLAVRRLLRCHPLHAGGLDPVPPRGSEPPASPQGEG